MSGQAGTVSRHEGCAGAIYSAGFVYDSLTGGETHA